MTTIHPPIAPPRIARGQTIGIIAPAGGITSARLRGGLDRLGETFRIALAPSLAAPVAPSWEPDAFAPTYLAAHDDVRVDEFHAMLRDPDIRAIVLARGGYGIMRILPRLDAELLRRDPKPIVGFSDATALLAWAHLAGVRGIHGPMIGQLGDVPDEHVAQLVRVLTDPTPLGVRPWALTAHGAGVYEGPLITANLTLASMLVGTPWALPLDGAILLLEEVGERPYELDRYLTQLALTGALRKPCAFVIGDLDKCEPQTPNDPPDAALRVMIERLSGRPTAVGAPVGHGSRNEALSFGAHACLDLDARTIEILDGAVS
ncbi:MAG: LD-carboxypeptidase [Proteobacteria bacterium]|nr:LD-carboxypeptidase [Pseudomonadota bacterium]